MNDVSLRLPLLTQSVADRLIVAQDRAEPRITLSLDLGRTAVTVEPHADHWNCPHGRFPYPFGLRANTIYSWSDDTFAPVEDAGPPSCRLVPSLWGPPLLEIEGACPDQMRHGSPLEAARVAALRVAPGGKRVLDAWGALGYGAHWCLAERAEYVLSVVPGESVLAMRNANPWSPRSEARHAVQVATFKDALMQSPAHGFDAVMHTPVAADTPGADEDELLHTCEALARVLAPGGVLVHATLPADRRDPHRHDERSMERALRAAGFEVGFDGGLVIACARPTAHVTRIAARRQQG